jgi:hypothetical protein
MQDAAPIILHADVRRMLLTQKAYVEGARMLTCWLGVQIDVECHHPDPERRRQAADLVSLLTPVAKAFLTDNTFTSANLALQVYGGHGYIVESGIEQIVRDARVLQIYEGTNGIQAMDLLGRKVLGDGRKRFLRFAGLIRSFVEEKRGGGALEMFMQPLENWTSRIEELSATLAEKAESGQLEAGDVAADFLRLVGHLCFAYLFARAADACVAAAAKEDPFHASKLETARFYFTRMLPEMQTCIQGIYAGMQSKPLLSEDALFL